MQTGMGVLNVLKLCQLFNGFTESQFDELIPFAREITCKQGEYIIKEGDRADMFFIIKSGMVEILKEEQKKHKAYRIRTFEHGESIGENALLVRTNRTASVRALTDVVLIGFKMDDIESKIDLNTRLAMTQNLSMILIEHLDFAYKVTIESMRYRIAKNRQVIFYQAISLFISIIFIYSIFKPISFFSAV